MGRGRGSAEGYGLRTGRNDEETSENGEKEVKQQLAAVAADFLPKSEFSTTCGTCASREFHILFIWGYKWGDWLVRSPRN